MAVDSVRQGTVSSDIASLAAALIARERQPITLLQGRRTDLTQRASVLGALKTRLLALRTSLDALGGAGTLSPFAAKAGTASDPNVLGVAATANAASGTLSVTVGQLARRATHASGLYTDTGTAISGAGAGTFTFDVTIAGTAHAVSVAVADGDTDRTVLDNVAAAITTAVGAAGSALRIQTETGKSRLSISSASTGTANKVTFTDTDGLLARLGVVNAAPTAATDTTGGYVYDDLGGHELDARLIVDGFTYYRDANTVTDLTPGVTLSLKGTSATAATVKIQADADFGLAKIKEFITRYNDVLDHLGQNTFVDAKAGTRGVLALDPVFADLGAQLRVRIAGRVGSQASGTPDSLAVLGIMSGADGKLSIKNETELRDKLIGSPGAVASLFNAADGVATMLETFVDGYSRANGQIAISQNQITLRIGGINGQIDRMNAALARKQTRLEDQLARGQALLQKLARQASQVSSIFGTV